MLLDSRYNHPGMTTSGKIYSLHFILNLEIFFQEFLDDKISWESQVNWHQYF